MASKCKFQGPAESEFSSFEDQALSSINDCCPHWNDDNEPRSYMIPPIFYFRHPEQPDHELEAIKRRGEFNRAVIDRTSDDAEHMIFDALNALVNERYAAPFVALHDLNMNRISAHLGQIFPGLPSSVTNQKFGEYDFVLIGPKIGLTVIEIKSTAFTQTRDFSFYMPKPFRRLPEQYQHGIEQLRSFDNALDFLEVVTRAKNMCSNRASVRRILFTPNLKRVRFDAWFDSLDPSQQMHLNERLQGIDRWFWEDAQPASQLCDKLRSYLDTRHGTHSLPWSLFGLYVPILTGLSSVTLTKTSIAIDSEALSEVAAVMRVSDCVESQNPWSLDSSNKKRKNDRPNQAVDLLKAIVLTPEQSAALRGPSGQFIVGAAGTGKTIILQAKALDLLRKGESVLVMCFDYYIGHYVDLFERHKLHGYTVKSWPKIRDCLSANAVSKILSTGESQYSDAVRSFVRKSLLDSTEATGLFEDYFKDLLDYNHILIDDVFAFAEEFTRTAVHVESLAIMYPMLIMAYAEQTSHWKTVWVALDPFTVKTYFLSPKQSYLLSQKHTEHPNPMQQLFYTGISQFGSCYFGTSCLNLVMRSPENIFRPLLLMSHIGPYQLQ